MKRLLGLLTSALVGAGVAALAGESGAGEAPVTPSEIVRSFAGLDGKHVAVTGTMSRVHQHISKKGEWSYSFSLSDESQAVTVLARARPSCGPGARVTVEGIVVWLSRRIDAISVGCDPPSEPRPGADISVEEAFQVFSGPPELNRLAASGEPVTSRCRGRGSGYCHTTARCGGEGTHARWP